MLELQDPRLCEQYGSVWRIHILYHSWPPIVVNAVIHVGVTRPSFVWAVWISMKEYTFCITIDLLLLLTLWYMLELQDPRLCEQYGSVWRIHILYHYWPPIVVIAVIYVGVTRPSFVWAVWISMKEYTVCITIDLLLLLTLWYVLELQDPRLCEQYG